MGVSIALLFLALLYSSIGHGGASGYLSVLLIAGYQPDELRELVLSMNLVVTSYILFLHRHKRWWRDTFLHQLTVFSIPFAFLGGMTSINAEIYRIIIGGLLVLSAIKLAVSQSDADIKIVQPNKYLLAVIGSLLGFISGFTGIGGGVFLSPLLLFLKWSTLKGSIPIVAAFIFVNSLFGLIGWYSNSGGVTAFGYLDYFKYIAIAMTGAVLGVYWSKERAPKIILNAVLALILSIAGLKMIFL